jgi:mono/diheme cytochrome c family protein
LFVSANLAVGQGGSDLLKQGQEVYEGNCADCHRSNGEGLPVKFPALKGNPFVLGDPKPLIELVLNGRRGRWGKMPAWREHLDDAQIAAMINYIRNAWENKASMVKTEEVARTKGARP